MSHKKTPERSVETAKMVKQSNQSASTLPRILPTVLEALRIGSYLGVK
jgi:hypothetical protein